VLKGKLPAYPQTHPALETIKYQPAVWSRENRKSQCVRTFLSDTKISVTRVHVCTGFTSNLSKDNSLLRLDKKHSK